MKLKKNLNSNIGTRINPTTLTTTIMNTDIVPPKRLFLRNRLLLFVLLSGLLLLLAGCGSPVGANSNSNPVVPSENKSTKVSEPPQKESAVPMPQPIVAAKEIDAIPVLYYHSVMVEAGNELRMPPDQLREQMKYLSDHAYKTITPGQLLTFLKGEGDLPEHPILITFDDGYADNFTAAYPIMKEFGFTATVFMISGALDSPGYMSTSQIQELAADGWTIGAHTKNHEHLPQLDGARQTQEIAGSKTVLEQKLGRAVTLFAYPFGEYNGQVEKTVRNGGFTLAFTTERGWVKRGADPLLLHRVYCYANMGLEEFQHRIQNPDY